MYIKHTTYFYFITINIYVQGCVCILLTQKLYINTDQVFLSYEISILQWLMRMRGGNAIILQRDTGAYESLIMLLIHRYLGLAIFVCVIQSAKTIGNAQRFENYKYGRQKPSLLRFSLCFPTRTLVFWIIFCGLPYVRVTHLLSGIQVVQRFCFDVVACLVMINSNR